MRDFTLIIPTYNRPHLLAALLRYLEIERADFHILVLDSSRPEVMATNRARLAAFNLDSEFAEFPDLNPAEKWRRGISQVTTPFCALCADDDIVILATLNRCLNILRDNVAAAAVQGYSFSFLPRPDGDIELNNIVYFTPTIDAASPLARLNTLFQQYQAPSYSVFRTPILQRAFEILQSVTETLARELLWSALTVIGGQLIRLPNFSYGRSLGPSGMYEHWHPLEWLCKDPDGLFSEYHRYRDLIAAAVIQRPDNVHDRDEIGHVLDLIHLRYLARHAPDSVLQFIAEQQMSGVDFVEYWPRHELHLPLYEAAGVGHSALENSGPLEIRGQERSYVLFPSFYAPRGTRAPQLGDIVHLIRNLDNYRPTTGPCASSMDLPLNSSSAERRGTAPRPQAETAIEEKHQ
jgi:glycosyltransferase domain-containing protein